MNAGCGKCKFFFKASNGNDQCRESAPVPMSMVEVLPSKGVEGVMAVWPPTREDNWCGKYQPKMVLTPA